MRKFLSWLLVIVLFASAVSLAVTPAGAQQTGIPFAGKDNKLTEEELVNAILPYMLGEGALTLDDVGDASWVYAHWDGKPKTIVDDDKQETTLYRPIERVVVLYGHGHMPLQTLKATDKVVGTDSTWAPYFPNLYHLIFPAFVDLPKLGSEGSPDYEKILELQPDLVLLRPGSIRAVTYTKLKELDPDTPVVRLYLYKTYDGASTVENYRTLGYLLEREEEAEEFIDYYIGFMDMLEEETSAIPEEDKPRVYYEAGSFAGYPTYQSGGSGGQFDTFIVLGGGINIFSDITGDWTEVSGEDVIRLDPEIIIKTAGFVDSGYSADDITGLRNVRDEIMNRDELWNVTAVKTGRVYAISSDMDCCGAMGGRYFLGIAYFAKCLHPDIDIDPIALHQEFLTRFQGLDYDLSTHGVFVYHPERFPEGR